MSSRAYDTTAISIRQTPRCVPADSLKVYNEHCSYFVCVEDDETHTFPLGFLRTSAKKFLPPLPILVVFWSVLCVFVCVTDTILIALSV
jgi:hypothetical protein